MGKQKVKRKWGRKVAYWSYDADLFRRSLGQVGVVFVGAGVIEASIGIGSAAPAAVLAVGGFVCIIAASYRRIER